jgi:hypothetical protein
MEALSSPETSVPLYQTTLRPILEDRYRNLLYMEALGSPETSVRIYQTTRHHTAQVRGAEVKCVLHIPLRAVDVACLSELRA